MVKIIVAPQRNGGCEGTVKIKFFNFNLQGAVWYVILSNNFQFLNNITHFFIYIYFHTLFHPHIFSKEINNIIRTTLSNAHNSLFI